MKILKSLTIVIIAIALTGCSDLTIKQEKKNPWTHLNLYNDPANFQFAIVADRTGWMRPGVFEKAVESLTLLKPEFVMSVGDLIEGYNEDEAKIMAQWNEFDSMVNKLEMPFFYVPGNHDVTNEVMAKIWRKKMGRLYYHFLYHNVLFLCIDSEDPPQAHEADNIGDKQMKYFKKVLAAYPNVRWTLLFLHKPMWHRDKGSWAKMEKLLADREYTVFTGHEHRYQKEIRNGRRYYALATTGGVGSGENGQLEGIEKGQFDHIVWVTMTDDGPVMTNLMLDGIFDDYPPAQKK